MGEEALCVAYYEQPELIHDILQTLGDTAFAVLETVSSAVPIDLLSVHEDMAGKSGPLAGPRQIAEFIAPYYRRIWELLHNRGARLFDQDSDGDMNPVLEAFLEAGVNCMHPMEPAASSPTRASATSKTPLPTPSTAFMPAGSAAVSASKRGRACCQ